MGASGASRPNTKILAAVIASAIALGCAAAALPLKGMCPHIPRGFDWRIILAVNASFLTGLYIAARYSRTTVAAIYGLVVFAASATAYSSILCGEAAPALVAVLEAAAYSAPLVTAKRRRVKLALMAASYLALAVAALLEAGLAS